MGKYEGPWSWRHNICAGVGLLMFVCSAPAIPPAGFPLRLHPAEIEASQDSLRVKLVNDGALAVRAFCMTSRNGPVEVTEDLPPRPPLVPAGGATVVTLRTGAVPADDLDAEARSFALTCVQWEDGSVEGRPEHVAMLLQIQAGRAFQLKRLRTVFDRIVQQNTDADWNAALASAAQWIAASGTTLDNGQRAEGSFATGMGSANLSARMDLDSLGRLSANSAGIAAARECLMDAISRHRATSDFLARVKGISPYAAESGRLGR